MSNMKIMISIVLFVYQHIDFIPVVKIICQRSQKVNENR
jgi:hypothetical protein